MRGPLAPWALLLLTVLAADCRPLKPGSKVRGLSVAADQLTVNITVTNQGITMQPETGGLGFTGAEGLALKTQASGRINTPVRPRQYVPLLAHADRLLFTFTLPQSGERSCRPDGGVPLKGRVAVVCSTSAERLDAVRAACRDLARDAAVATYDSAADTCTCARRKLPQLAFADYLGDVPRFLVDCRNAATAAELRSLCAELRDRYCPSCQVGEQGCQCARGVELSYASSLSDVEDFRSRCAPLDPAATATTATGTVVGSGVDETVRGAFEVDCGKTGTLRTASGSAPVCDCANGQTVTLEAFRADAGALAKACP